MLNPSGSSFGPPLLLAAARWAGSAVPFALTVVVASWARDGFEATLLVAGPMVAVLTFLPALVGIRFGRARGSSSRARHP